jgi:flavin reductase (DIM6/NTAB) family NADH-FMN oxidoreductase RutF
VVHVLPESHGLAELFGGQGGDHVDSFAVVRWAPGPVGASVLVEAVAWFAGRVEHQAD